MVFLNSYGIPPDEWNHFYFVLARTKWLFLLGLNSNTGRKTEGKNSTALKACGIRLQCGAILTSRF